MRRLSGLLVVVGALLCFAPPGPAVGMATGGTARTKDYIVCTETFKAGLTSFFTSKDTAVSFAEDSNELCEMCAKVMRLAFLYANDVQTTATWSAALENSACNFVSDARRADCLSMTKGIITAQRKFFDGKKSKFTRAELKGTTEQLGMMVDARAYGLCRKIACCRAQPKPRTKAPLTPCSKPGDAKDVQKDREAVQKDRFYLDRVREELFTQRRKNNDFRAKLDLREIDLNSKLKQLKKDQDLLKKEQQKLKEAREALQRREDRVKRREKQEQELKDYNKKKEKWLAKREELVSDREEICWKREDQLSVPHPPTSRPPKPPAAPVQPSTRPPSDKF
jgi:hypothetical protein